MVKPIQNLEEFNETVKKTPIVICDYFATWCGPCMNIAPLFKELHTKYAKNKDDIKFVKIDVDKCADVAQQQGISAMPTFQIFKKGEKIAEWQGASKAQLRKHIVTTLRDYLGADFKPDPNDLDEDEDPRGSFWMQLFLVLMLGSLFMQFFGRR